MNPLTRVLSDPSHGNDVLEVQTILVALGFLTLGDADGWYGPNTASAVRKFQASEPGAKLGIDGKVGPATWRALHAAAPAEMPPSPFEFDTAGDHPADVDTRFIDGWWSGARRAPIHAYRQGGAITPRTVTLHSTDMARGTMRALMAAWAAKPGAGAGAHFLVGRKPPSTAPDGVIIDGVAQFTSITRNGNHAGGGNGYGQYKLASGALVHPNRWAVGIEIDAGGLLKRRDDGQYVHPDSNTVIPPDEVFIGPSRRAWHMVTEYQFDVLADLLGDLGDVLAPVPVGTTLVPNGGYQANGVPWAAQDRDYLPDQGHITLDPRNKTDPGEQVLEWLRAWRASRPR